MNTKLILESINQISPFMLQESWDNSGLLLDNHGECEQLVISLDIDDALANSVAPNSCILLHHPLIFKGLKTLAQGHEARILLKLAAKNCSLIAAHTNFDKTHLNRYLCEEVLGLKIKYCEDFVCFCENPYQSLESLAEDVKKSLNLSHLRAVIATNRLNGDIAVCCGAGASMAASVYDKAAVYLTGDIKYHEALAAKLNGLNMLDITHFASEKCFVQAAADALKNLPIKVTMGTFLNPFADI